MIDLLLPADPDFAMRWLAARIAHELGGPLTAINVSIGQMMKRECATCPVSGRDLGVVLSQSKRLADLSRRLVDLAGPAEPNFAPVDASDVVAEVLDLVAGPLGKAGIEVEFDRSPEPLLVSADAHQMQQVLLHLVLNAQKALGAAGGTVWLATHHRDKQAELIVADNGPGIAAEDLRKVFLPFWSKSGGTGVGLSMARSIMHAHNGSIEVSSGEGSGAVFTVRLPVGAI